MATTKTLNTRILLRYDEYTNWYNNNPKLLKGEVAIATIPENHTDPSTGAVTQIPAVVMKVGTGAETGSNYRDLPFVSAKAADVLAACKSEDSLKTFINNVIASADMATNDKFTELSGKVDTLNGDVNTTGSVAKAIKDAIDALDLANTYVAKETNKSLVSDSEITKLAGVSEGANKVEKSDTNGNIKVDGAEVTVYTHPEKHEIADVDGLQDAINDAKKAGTDANSALETYKGTNDQALANEVKAREDADNAINNKIGEVAEGKTVVGLIVEAKKAGDDAQADVNALELNVGGVDSLSTTNKTVVGAINEVLAAVGTGGTAAVVTVEKSTDGLTYTIKQGEATVGTIDIPKDMVVTAGEVVTNPEGQAEGTYIKLTLANVADPLFINVGTLVDIYKAQANATQVQVAIDTATREISATIVAGSINTAELADNAVITAKIADANITKAKLSTEVQASLDLADSAVQEDDIADLRSASHTHTFKDTDVEDAISKKHDHTFADTDVDDAISKKHAHTFVESELNKIKDGDVDTWNTAAQDYVSKSATNEQTIVSPLVVSNGKGGSELRTVEVQPDKLTFFENVMGTTTNLTQEEGEGGTTHNVNLPAENGTLATREWMNANMGVEKLTQAEDTVLIFDCGDSNV